MLVWQGTCALRHHPNPPWFVSHEPWRGKDGQKRYITEVVAEQVLLMDKKEKLIAAEGEDEIDTQLPF